MYLRSPGAPILSPSCHESYPQPIIFISIVNDMPKNNTRKQDEERKNVEPKLFEPEMEREESCWIAWLRASFRSHRT